jgi:hypothetical protein
VDIKNVGRQRKMEILTSPFCPACGNQGYVKYFYDGVVTMECDCSRKWDMFSGVCPHCNNPNGYPGDGTCTPCYRKGLR